MPQTFNVGARSLFVTITAWVFIALAALGSLSSLIQNATILSLTPGLHVVGDAVNRAASLPMATGFLMSYLPWVLGAGLLLSLATLACAIGLLLRLDWARRVFIGLLTLAIVANLAGLWIQHEMVLALVSSTLAGPALPPYAAGVFGGFVTAARVMAVLMTLLSSALMAWIIRGLMSTSVRQEFA